MNHKDEQALRENIRHLIKHVKSKRQLEQKQIKESIATLAALELQKMLQEREVAAVDPAPNKSTGINVLEDLLKKIVPVLEVDYKSLTTNQEQRDSFRAHIINAIVSTLTPVEVNNEAGEEETATDLAEQELDITIGDDEVDNDEDKFIDIRTDAERKEEEEGEEVDPRDEFGLEDQDETGRNMAYASFKKIETSIIDSYELLSNPEDQELFYDYLIANAKLYFDKFEGELSPDVSEPTNQAYDMAKGEQGGAESEEEMSIDL